MKTWKAWSPTMGETRESALTIQATTPRKAAIRWAEESEKYSGPSVIDAGEVDVAVCEVSYGDEQTVSITATKTVDYRAKLIEGD
jgi:hypothetical protein